MQKVKTKLKIALTGGYASGKSTVLKRFAEKGFLTYSADLIYAELLENEEFVRKISEILGISFETVNGKLYFDRRLVSGLVFNDKEKLASLNSFTHKAVYDRINEIYDNCDNCKIIFEIPLLFEDGKQDDFDLVIVVMRNAESRIRAGALRDEISEDNAVLRIKNQFDYNKIAHSEHTLIYNDGSIDALNAEVDGLIEKIERSCN